MGVLGRPVARRSTGANELHYLTRDHLGSIDTITSAGGSVELRLSFGAFGERRDAADAAGNPTSGDWAGIGNTTRRGFTFHEMLDNLNLTHMNGRVYDPLAARFLSPDPYVQAPELTQSFNRYAYTLNNPLSYTDPSGYRPQGGPDDPQWDDSNAPACPFCPPSSPSVLVVSYPRPHLPPQLTFDLPVWGLRELSTVSQVRPSISESLASTERHIAELEALLAMGDGTTPYVSIWGHPPISD